MDKICKVSTDKNGYIIVPTKRVGWSYGTMVSTEQQHKWNSRFMYYMVEIHGVNRVVAEKQLSEFDGHQFATPEMEARNYIHKDIENRNNICGGW